MDLPKEVQIFLNNMIKDFKKTKNVHNLNFKTKYDNKLQDYLSMYGGEIKEYVKKNLK